MPTIKQLLKKPRSIFNIKCKDDANLNFPQKKGICLKVYTTSPKKPNSAERKVSKILLSNRKQIIAYISGEGHSLQEHSVILVRRGRIKDLPGVKYRVVRGVYDLLGVVNRKKGRSKYGTKKAPIV